jgi:tetraacyldisaccharide 4'-kinase
MTGRRQWLAPAALLYGGLGRARAALYARRVLPRARLGGRVISVGNLSVGGSGKTPLVALIAATLRDAGLPVSVLSRGYGGTFRGRALVVSDGRDVHAAAAAAGDEPVMLARQLPGVVVAVGRRRDDVGRVVEERFGARVHVLDDGFQHLRLHRDLDVLCASAADLRDLPLPAGRLREPASGARRADVLMLSEAGSPEEAAAAAEPWPRERVFRLRRRVEGFFDRGGRAQLPPARPYLVAGIARPQRFGSDVRALVAEVSGQRFFPDHHRYQVEDLAEIESDARRAGADALVTTAKDAERLPPEWRPLPVHVLRVAAEVDDPQRFRRLLLAAAGAGA